MHNYEVEIKVLLGTREQKDAFMDQVHRAFPTMSQKYSESQLNHYFVWGNLAHLFGTFREYISDIDATSLHQLSKEAKSFSVRTRSTERGETIIVVKATVNDESSSNGTARIEWEVNLAPMTLDEMDALVLQAGFSYQAKWSRARDAFELETNTILCLDKNAWYGYLAEFERVIDDPNLVESTRADILQMIESLGYHELDQDRLARMFDFYNKNWSEYYGTENVFTIE